MGQSDFAEFTLLHAGCLMSSIPHDPGNDAPSSEGVWFIANTLSASLTVAAIQESLARACLFGSLRHRISWRRHLAPAPLACNRDVRQSHLYFFSSYRIEEIFHE